MKEEEVVRQEFNNVLRLIQTEGMDITLGQLVRALNTPELQKAAMALMDAHGKEFLFDLLKEVLVEHFSRKEVSA